MKKKLKTMERQTYSLRSWSGSRVPFGYWENATFYWEISFDKVVDATLRDYSIYDDVDDEVYSLKEFVFDVLTFVVEHDESTLHSK